MSDSPFSSPLGRSAVAGMTLAEQVVRRVELAQRIGAKPYCWIATADAHARLVAEVDPGAWAADRALLHGIPIALGQPKSEYGLDLVLAPRGA